MSISPSITNYLDNIAHYALENYENPSQDVKKLTQKERKYLDIALRYLNNDPYTLPKMKEKQLVAELSTTLTLIKAKRGNKTPREAAVPFKKVLKEVGNRFHTRIGCHELAGKILKVRAEEKKEHDRPAAVISDDSTYEFDPSIVDLRRSSRQYSL